MPQIRTGHIESDGAAINVPLGFVPSYVKVINQSAATGEVMAVEWFGGEMDDSVGFHTTIIADNGSTANTNMSYASSSSYISEYNAATVDTGTTDSDTDPVRVTGGKGFTIAATFSDDSDELWYLAIGADRDTDHGDINA